MNGPTTPVEFIDEFLTGLIVEEEAAERTAAMASKQRRLPAVEIVRKHLSDGMQKKQIAALYGVSAPAVSQLLKRAAAVEEAPSSEPAAKPARAYQCNEPVVLGDGQVFLRLMAASKAAGIQAELARRMGVSRQHLHDILNSDRAQSPAVLRYLRLKRLPAPARYSPVD